MGCGASTGYEQLPIEPQPLSGSKKHDDGQLGAAGGLPDGCDADISNNFKSLVAIQWSEALRTVDSKKQKQKSKVVIKRSNWKIIRIFVSSTFKDFHAEREHLVKQVFPELRTWCESRRLRLVECDLRWGVPADTNKALTLKTCLGEIDRCYQDNIMPFFLNMTSERCGWIPSQRDVPESVMKEYRWIVGLSVTEMEIMHAAYRIDNPNALFLLRDCGFLERVPDKYKDEFVESQPDLALQKLQMLRSQLYDRFTSDCVVKYSCEFGSVDDKGKFYFLGLDGIFTKTVLDFFKKRIEAQYPLDTTPKDVFAQQLEMHNAFMKNRGEVVLGRSDILLKISDYICGPSPEKAFILLGGPGLGKSSIMAKAVDTTVTKAMQMKIPGGGMDGWFVFYHFVGATPDSTTLESMLKRFLLELKIVNNENMPKDLESLCQRVRSVLSNVNTRATVLMIDAVNQFTDEREVAAFKWLPKKLAPKIRCIMSMIDNTPPHVALNKGERAPKQCHVTPLDRKSREEIVISALGQYGKTLDVEQMSALMAKGSSENPLWLSIACEELRVFGEYSKVSDQINKLEDDLLQLLIQVLTRFEKENGGRLLIATLCLLEVSSNGLLETELLSILGQEETLLPETWDFNPFEEAEKGAKEKGDSENFIKEGGQLPAAKWASVFRALKPFLRPFGDSGEGRLDFYHRSLSKAVRIKYFNNDDDVEDDDDSIGHYWWWHQKLNTFFSTEKNIDRKIEEYPYHLSKVQNKQKLADFLSDWEIFDKLFDTKFSNLLLRYWRCAGGYPQMKSRYIVLLQNLVNSQSTDDGLEIVCCRYEQIARVFVQAGLYEDAALLLDRALEIEVDDLGGRPLRVVELHESYVKMYDELTKRHAYFNRKQLEELRPLLQHARKIIEYRKNLPGKENQYRLGWILMTMAFHLSGWRYCGGDNELTRQDAGEQATKKAQEAIAILEKLDDPGLLAEAIMTKGTTMNSCNEQIDVYKKAMELSLQIYGEFSLLSQRVFNNIAIAYEESGNINTAYDHFKTWYHICIELFGDDHPKTSKAIDVMRETTYVRIATERGDPLI